jgi:hypothetical protein
LLDTDVIGAEARFTLAVIAARWDDFEACERWIALGRPAVEVGAFDRCLARVIDATADAAASRGRGDIAEPLWALGEMQWRRLGTQTVSPRE